MTQSYHSERRGVAARLLGAGWRIALVAFHAILLAGRVADGSLLEPAVLGRWCGALALFVAVALYQRFVPVRLRGRRALIVFWILAAFLHFFGPIERIGEEIDLELALTLVLPALALAIVLPFANGPAPALRAHPSWSLRLQAAPARRPAAPRGPPARCI